MDATVKKQKHPDRITLLPQSLAKIRQWVEQLNLRNPGVTATRSELVDWLIETHAAELSSSELNNLEENFFDSVKYAKWAVKMVIESKARGENLSLKLIGKDAKVSVHPGVAKVLNRKEKKTKLTVTASSTNNQQDPSLFQSENNKDESLWPDGK